MKILITTDLFRPAINGVVTSVLNLERELEKNGHEVKILAVSDTCSTYQMENVYYRGDRLLLYFAYSQLSLSFIPFLAPASR